MKFFSSLVAAGLLAGNLQAQWPEFRGPNADGTVDSKGLPTEWSAEKNVTWKKEIHGLGWSTPLISEGKLWLTTATEDGREMSILCFDEKSGEVLLDRVFITNDNPEPLANNMNTYASSTGVVEPGRIYIHFGAYGTFCLDTETFETLWQRRDLTCSHWRGPASSLAKWEDKIILTMEGADQQYFVALNKGTGETLWRRDRGTHFDDETDGVPANSGDMRKAYSTPIFVKVGETVQMISNGAKAAWAYDVETGEEIWNVHYPTHSPSSRSVYSPETNMVYINTGLGKAEIWAVKLDPEARGDISESHVAWKIFQRTPKRMSPVISNGLLFMANGGVLSAVDIKTGDIAWAERGGGEYSASSIAANGLVYHFDEEGLCTVLKAAGEFEVVSENQLEGGFMGSPAVSGEALFLRTKTHLYRVEN
ncbi:MAG: PQQ-binding-like beta-propeller repeat protein [Verrucomicrobiales bacterium]|nr:PQQ-binding-like beta-propeller repeat protein [Verrucomicrobiales bacterium]